jgi:tetratricopeptide (TPR) repeat protein
LACALALQGERDEAARALEAASTAPTGTGVGIFLARRAVWFGEAARRCGRRQEATRLAEEGFGLARAHNERGDEAWALRLLGDLASDGGQFPEADGHYRDALALADALGMRPLVAHCHQGLGGLARGTGDLDRARHELGAARELYRDMDMTVWLEGPDAELAELG